MVGYCIDDFVDEEEDLGSDRRWTDCALVEVESGVDGREREEGGERVVTVRDRSGYKIKNKLANRIEDTWLMLGFGSGTDGAQKVMWLKFLSQKGR